MMKVGLLWYDDNPKRDLAEKVGRAAQRYKRKFGAAPDICCVHPSAFGDNGSDKVQMVGDVRVVSRPSVLRHHFWLGQEEKRRGNAKERAGQPAD